MCDNLLQTLKITIRITIQLLLHPRPDGVLSPYQLPLSAASMVVATGRIVRGNLSFIRSGRRCCVPATMHLLLPGDSHFLLSTGNIRYNNNIYTRKLNVHCYLCKETELEVNIAN